MDNAFAGAAEWNAGMTTLQTNIPLILLVGVSVALLYLGITHISRGRKKIERT